ncbi:heavy metal translocating P-type ATPase [Fulvimonas soli]|uniref:Cu2+-exporting ATPase n=1 Tax=Fulvimonas soli TaxID=155197 RepID=A0A316HYJ7_9GAMM|nr:heavy metal translocating P-type ATPase [Fulvimonas soli]PWK85758.1 Cu2+-exporting ATPase [Fulvimonas soli]TNY25705.1 ATPase P [Fulvimonas soli]
MIAHAAWAHPQLAAQVLRPRRDGRAEVTLRVAPLDDPRRVLRLEQALHALPGVQRVAIDRAARRVRVVWDPRRAALPQLLAAAAGAAGSAQPLHRGCADDAPREAAHDLLKRLLVAGMCAMQVMTYAFVLYIGAVDWVDVSTRGLFRWLGMLTTIPVVFYSARPFFAGALRELRARRLGIDLPVALAVALVFLASALHTVQGRGEIYFDSVAMFVFLLLAARHVALQARLRSGALGEAATDAAPLLAERRGADGALETVPALALLPGDAVHVAEGATVPADGVLESAAVQVDEALLSGESRPLTRRRGERLVAGSVLLSGPAELRVEQAGRDGTAARLGALAQRARQARPTPTPAEGREIGRFVARVLLLVALTAAGWLLVDPARAFEASLAVLVVACPCAFALTRPAVQARAFGALAQRGVLLADEHALDALARADYALFDKTGTLTVPQLQATGTVALRGCSPAQALRLAGALAQESAHPLARALAAAAGRLGFVPRATAVQVAAGAGIAGEVEGRPLRLGQARFALAPAGQAPTPAMEGALVLADAEGALALFRFEEPLREGTAELLAAWRDDGIVPVIASGDDPARVAALARRVGTGEWHARQAPADKLALLQAARAAGRTTLAVGDGSNDAPVLAGADVAAALASGTDLAQAHADVLLMDGRLDGLAHARAVARQARRIAAQGRRWALAYNLCAVPFAAFGLVPPWLAGIGMSLSSLLVVLNALRVGRGPAAPRRGRRA